jgi:hypothetical protein
MWLLSFIPEELVMWVVNTLIIIGVAGFGITSFFGFVTSWFPAIAPYRSLIQIISVILLIAGVYFKGAYSVEIDWRAKVAKLEAKVKLAEEKTKTANVEIRTVYVDKVRVVKETQVVIKEKIKKDAAKIDSQCKVAPEVISILNDAATGVPK